MGLHWAGAGLVACRCFLVRPRHCYPALPSHSSTSEGFGGAAYTSNPAAPVHTHTNSVHTLVTWRMH